MHFLMADTWATLDEQKISRRDLFFPNWFSHSVGFDYYTLRKIDRNKCSDNRSSTRIVYALFEVLKNLHTHFERHMHAIHKNIPENTEYVFILTPDGANTRQVSGQLSFVVVRFASIRWNTVNVCYHDCCYLTLKMPRKPASENVVCLCRLLNILANFSNLFFHTGKQSGPWSDCS